MKPEIARVFWESGIWLEFKEDGGFRAIPMPHKKGRIRDCDLMWLRDNKEHVGNRLRKEGDCHALGLDMPLFG